MSAALSVSARSRTRPGVGDGAMVEELLRAEAVLDSAAFWMSGAMPGHDCTVQSVEAVLDVVQLDLIGRLAAPETAAADRGAIAMVLLEIGECRAALRQGQAAWRAEALTSATSVGNRLNPAVSIDALLQRAPAELCRIGYDRCLISTIEGGKWIAQSAYVHNDPGLAREIVAAGSASPRTLGPGLVEFDLVRRRETLWVRDPQHNPHVHRELIRTTGTTAYIAAPIVVDGSVVGLIHADESRHTRSVDEFDRELLAVSAECLSFSYERVLYRERIQRLRKNLQKISTSIMSAIDDADADEPAGSAWPPRSASRLSPVASAGVASAPRHDADCLTQREHEVLQRMAAGQRNAEIAADLFITEATVKAHVKHIFRKLSVANRAEAVSRFLLARS